MAPRGDLAGRLAATLNKSLKGRARRSSARPVFWRQPESGFFLCGRSEWDFEMELTNGRKQDSNEGRERLATGDELVHEGTLRSQFGETSEAIFLNSGYIYASAEQAEARFKGDEDGYVYSRYANPTVSMFETRMCALEGADAARGTSSGMAAVTDASFVAIVEGIVVGAILVTLAPGGDASESESFAWHDEPPPGLWQQTKGQPHLTWIFVRALRAGRRHRHAAIAAGRARAQAAGVQDDVDDVFDRQRVERAVALAQWVRVAAGDVFEAKAVADACLTTNLSFISTT